MVKEINDKDFSEVIKEGKVLVDCFANWCGPCKMLSPIIDSLAEELTDVKFFKLDVDNSEVVTSTYGIMSIPTLLIFNNGELVEKIVGLRSKNEIKEILEK